MLPARFHMLLIAGNRSDNNTLPEPLRRVLEDPNHPEFNKFPYDVALAMEPGVYSMCWKTKNDQVKEYEVFLTLTLTRPNSTTGHV